MGEKLSDKNELTARALILVHIEPFQSYWYVMPSQ